MKRYNRPDCFITLGPNDQFALTFSDCPETVHADTVEQAYKVAAFRDVIWGSAEDAWAYYYGAPNWNGQTYDWENAPHSVDRFEEWVVRENGSVGYVHVSRPWGR